MRFWARPIILKRLSQLLLLSICFSPFFFMSGKTQAARAAACPPEGCKIYLPAVFKYVDQITNGDFEMGAVGWKEFSAQNYLIILLSTELQKPPHSGAWAAWLGGDDEETASIDQDIFVSAVRPYLQYWQWIVSDEANCSNDEAKVLINAAVLAQENLCLATNTNAWEQRSIDLNAFVGQIVNLKFWVSTDPTVGTISSLYLDDISLQVTP